MSERISTCCIMKFKKKDFLPVQCCLLNLMHLTTFLILFVEGKHQLMWDEIWHRLTSKEIYQAMLHDLFCSLQQVHTHFFTSFIGNSFCVTPLMVSLLRAVGNTTEYGLVRMSACVWRKSECDRSVSNITSCSLKNF